MAVRSRVTLDYREADQLQTGAVCGGGNVRCFAHVLATEDGFVSPAAPTTGFTPTDLQSAYKIPTAIGGTPLVAIIDAYGYANLESDLAMYRSTFGLPPCTTNNGCLHIVNQEGNNSPLPAQAPSSDDWTIETALDVDMASAACPKCKILVVQADDDTGTGLYVAQNTAASLGAAVISNSWGGPERAGLSLDANEAYFAHDDTVAIFVSAGDAGFNDAGEGPDYPGTSAHVIAVGGTHLSRDTSTRGWSETAWEDGGSACSLSIAKPAYQSGSGCSFKATTDIAAVGDPQTGVAVYHAGNGGWTVVGGTSAAAPLVAAMWAATGNGRHTSGEYIKQNTAKLWDVTSGSNGACGSILCTAGIGWDGPTGYGTPNAAQWVTAAVTGDGGETETSDDDDANVIGGCSASGSGSGLLLVSLVLVRGCKRRGTASRRA
ncbi:MAG TPA: S53 family peptidase [Kofleriaceae bacterium]